MMRTLTVLVAAGALLAGCATAPPPEESSAMRTREPPSTTTKAVPAVAMKSLGCHHWGATPCALARPMTATA